MPDFTTTLRDELVAATARLNRQSRAAARRRKWRGAGAALALMVTVPTAAAVGGVWHPFTEGDGLTRLSPDQVVASGRLAAEGRWQLLTSDSSAGRCLEIRFLDPRTAPLQRGGACGIPADPHFGSIGAGPRDSRSIIFGTASPSADTVQVRGARIRKPVTHADGRSYFLLQGPANSSHLCVETFDRAGALVDRIARSLDEPGTCTRAPRQSFSYRSPR